MKRYIYMALALLIGATSCEMTDGVEREPIEVGEYLGSHTISLYEQTLNNFDNAIVADWYLSTEDESIRKAISTKYLLYEGSVVSYSDEDNGVVRVQYNSYDRWSDKSEMRTYIEFATDGKLLSEGGVWRMASSSEKGITIRSNEEGVYTIVCEQSDLTYKLVISELSLSIENNITYKVDGGICKMDDDVEYPDVILDTEITTTLERTRKNREDSYFKYGGEIYIECDDRRIDRIDVIELLFKNSHTARIKYLNYTSSIRY